MIAVTYAWRISVAEGGPAVLVGLESGCHQHRDVVVGEAEGGAGEQRRLFHTGVGRGRGEGSEFT